MLDAHFQFEGADMLGQRIERRISADTDAVAFEGRLDARPANDGDEAPGDPDAQRALVRIIEGDVAFRQFVAALVTDEGYDVAEYTCARHFLEHDPHCRRGCLILDVMTCEMSGLDLQIELGRAGIETPVVFLTGEGNIRMTVQAMRAGAIDFLTKPVSPSDLLNAIEKGVAQDRARKEVSERRRAMQERFGQLTSRQREVLTYVRSGMKNKRMAENLGVTEITIKVHRAAAMRKLGIKSVVELVLAFELIDS